MWGSRGCATVTGPELIMISTVLSLKMLTISVDSMTPPPASPFFFLGPRIDDSSCVLIGMYLVERCPSNKLC